MAQGAHPGPSGPIERDAQSVERLRSSYRWTPPPAKADSKAGVEPAKVGPFQASSVLDIVFTLSGVGLGLFMVMHTSLLSSILGGPHTLNVLAEFLERYYLLQVGWPPLVLLALVHIVLSLRRAPATFRQQRLLWRQMGWLGHMDTITWGFQVASAIFLGILIAIHLWVTLTDLPITAEKAADFVKNNLWFTLPFTLLVAGHTAIGFYRAAVKWGVVPRRWAYALLGVMLLFYMGMGYTITVLLLRVET